MTKQINVILFNGKTLTPMTIDSGYKALQALVDGLISMPFLGTTIEKEGIDMIINDEGKLLELPPSLLILQDVNSDNHEENIVELLAGNVVFARHTEDGETISVRDGDLELIKSKLVYSGLEYLDEDKRVPLKAVLIDGDF